MKCPHCQEELGLNNICINPACSYFGAIINSFEKSDLNDTENNLDNKNSFNNESNLYTSNTNTNTNTNTNNNKFNNTNLNPKFNNANSNFNNNRSNYNIDTQNINKDNYTSDNISKEELAAFIGNNTNYYLDYTDKMKKNTNFISWNWPCFFLGTYWLLYRKLYAVAAIFFAINIGTSLLIPGALPLLMRILLAMFANALYLNHSVRQIKTVKSIIANLSATQYINRLRKKGGVNLAAPFILVGIYILIIVIVVAVSLSETGIAPHNFSSPSYNY